MKNEIFMKEKPVLPLIISMALPMVISMCVNSLYNIVDSYFVAKISENAMTALSLVYPVQNFINAVAIGFGVGINAVIAFHLGAGDKDKADDAATQGLLLSLIHGVVLTVSCIFIMKPFLSAFTKDENVISLGVQYCNIVFLFTIINSLNLFFENLLLNANHDLKNRYLHIDYNKNFQSATYEISKCQNDTFEKENGTLELSLEDLVIIKALKENPQITQKDLAVKVGKSERSIKRKTVLLQEKGFIKRESGKRNGKWIVLIDNSKTN